MAFSKEELSILQTAKANGFTRQQAEDSLMNYWLGIKPNEGNKSGLVYAGGQKNAAQALGDITIGAGKEFLDSSIGTARLLQTGGQAILAGIDPTRNFAQIQKQTGIPALKGEQALAIDDMLKSSNAEQSLGKVIGFGAELGVGGGFNLARKGVQKGVGLGERVLARGAKTFSRGSEALGSVASQGLKQSLKDVAERFPRYFGRVRTGIEESAQKAARLERSAPSVQNAIKSNLNDGFITYVEKADNATLKASKEMVDIAEKPRVGLTPKRQPSIVAGRVINDQYNIINKERQAVGKKIEEAINNLPDSTVDMRPSIKQVEDILAQNRIIVKDGVLQSPILTNQQLARLQELYSKALEASGKIDAKLVHGMDRVFSQLQREARFEKLDNIFLKVNGKDVNAFDVFRGIFRNQLDNLSPKIRSLNNEYRILRTTQNSIDKTLLKAPNVQLVNTSDPAEFAKVNLRRLMGEAQSSPLYREVAQQTDLLARDLGYKGAKAEDLINFAEELRKLNPESIPKTGFIGGIRTGVSDIVKNVLNAGAPDVKYQQKALRILLEDALKKSAKSITK